MEFFLSNNKYTLPYRIYGYGSRSLFAFHGFGRTGEDFQVFEKELGNKFTIYAFDLPYHGQASVAASLKKPAFTKQDLKDIIELFCKEKNIDRFSVMGYSLGGKIALGCVEVFVSRIENIYLLAPDGLKINPFYFFGTRTWFGRYLFKSVIDHPGLLFNTGNFLEKLKWINPKINHFVKHHMDTKQKRKKVFQVWMLFRKFIPDQQKISSAVNINDIGILMFFGKYDSVIPPGLAQNLIVRLKNKNVLHVLVCGHRLLEKHHEIERLIKISPVSN